MPALPWLCSRRLSAGRPKCKIHIQPDYKPLFSLLCLQDKGEVQAQIPIEGGLKLSSPLNMEINVPQQDPDCEEDYVLLDLDEVSGIIEIPPNSPYVLSGLDTANPLLVIGDKLKLIGEYEETIGTCLIFTEEDIPVVYEETGTSEANLFSGKCIVDPNEPPRKEIKPVTMLQKVLKFRLISQSDVPDKFEQNK